MQLNKASVFQIELSFIKTDLSLSTLFDIGSDETADRLFLGGNQSNALVFYVANATPIVVLDRVVPDVAYHLVITISRTNATTNMSSYAIFINGILSKQQMSQIIPSAGKRTSAFLGKSYNRNEPQYLNGAVDAFRMSVPISSSTVVMV